MSETTRLVVTFETAGNNSKAQAMALSERLGYKVIKQYGRRLVLDLGAPFHLEVQRKLLTAEFTAVHSVELDYLVNAGQAVSELFSASSQTPLWNLKDDEPHSIKAEGIWRITNSTPDVVVAVIDSGIAQVAESIFLHLLEGYDFITDVEISMDGDGRDSDSTDPGDWGDMCPTPSWHGTKVASILAARHDNQFGMKGIAQNCSVLPLRVLGLCRMGYATDVTDAILWAAGGILHGVPLNQNPAKIISLSLVGQGACPNYLQSAVTQAIELGAKVVVAAGNNNQQLFAYFPVNCEGVVTVAASTREGKLAPYSNKGSGIVAPGGDHENGIMMLSVNALETAVNVFYGFGTSFAAPHISGIMALLQARNMSLQDGGQYSPIAWASQENNTNVLFDGNIISLNFQLFNQKNGSEIVYATETCPNRVDSYLHVEVRGKLEGDSGTFSCPNNCFVFKVIVCMWDNGIRNLQFQCSRGAWSPLYGSTSCRASEHYTLEVQPNNAFEAVLIEHGNDINGIRLRQVNQVLTSNIGCLNCQTKVAVHCENVNTGYRRLITGMEVRYTSSFMKAIGLHCHALRCNAGWRLSSSTGICEWCNIPSLDGMFCSGGLNDAIPWRVTSCSAGNYLTRTPSFEHDGQCSECLSNHFCTGGTETARAWTVTSCNAGHFLSTQPSRSTNGHCSVCPSGHYCLGGTNQAIGCTSHEHNQCANCARCTPGTYLLHCGGSSAGSCVPCPSCESGQFISGCGGTSAGTCQTCAAGTTSGPGAFTCYPIGSRTAYLLPGISPTCRWMHYRQVVCNCNQLSAVVWNENNGLNPLSSGLPAACSSCDLTEHVGGRDNCWVRFRRAVPSFGNVPALSQAPSCSQCYQSIASVSTIPANCASATSPTVQQCYFSDACSGCGCFRNQRGTTAMCHSCNAGFFSSPPSFTTCHACPVGSFSATAGLLNAEEADVSTITYSFSSTQGSSGCNSPQLDSNGAWCSNVQNDGWTQIDLGRTRTIRGFVTQGRSNAAQWVTGYTITTSLDGMTWSSFTNNAYAGNSDSNTRHVQFVFTGGAFSSLTARHVRLRLTSSTSFHQHFSLRWNVLVVPITSENSALNHLAPCTPCPSGSISIATGSSQCSSCSPGSFTSTAGASRCETCASIPAQGRFTSLCNWVCHAGLFKNTDTSCASCSLNNTCAAGFFRHPCSDGIHDALCSFACPAAILPRNAVFVVFNDINRETSCWWGCNQGFYRSSIQTTATCLNSTITCNRGFYPSSPSYNAITHTTTAPSCATCSPAIENADFSGPGNANSPSSCPYTCKHQYFKLTERGQCNQWTLTCNAGFFWTAGTSTSDATCTECSPNYAAGANRNNYIYDTNLCTYKCNAGFGIRTDRSNQCIECVAGKYQNPATTSLNSLCTDCGPSQFQNSPGSESCLNVPLHGKKNGDGSDFTCNAGYYYRPPMLLETVGTCPQCAVCGAGSYWSSACGGTSAGTCEACTHLGCSDTFFRTGCSGSSAGSCAQCAMCSSGSFFGSCTGGSLSDTRTCTFCEIGKAGGGGYLKACTDCVAGTFASGLGAVVCSTCSAGKYSSGARASVCTDCNAGKYSSAVGATSDCLVCAEGSFCSSPSLQAFCRSGTFCPAGSSQETACAAGTFRACTPGIVHFRCVSHCVNDLGAFNMAPWNNLHFVDSGARWVWNSAGAASNALTSPDFSLSKRLYITPCHPCLAGDSLQVRFHVMVDNYCSVHINHVLVHSISSGIWSGQGTEFTSSLVAGFNTIRFVAGNSGGAAGIAFALYCTRQDTSASTLLGRSDNTWCLGASCAQPESLGVFVPIGEYQATSSAVIGAACSSCSSGKFSAAGASFCSDCTAGKFSAGGVGQCSDCAPIPSQAQFVSLCEWKCNVGFYKASATACASCTSNTSCNAGVFRPPCIDGIHDSPCSSTCPTLSSNAVYVDANAVNSETSCWWGCNQGFYRTSSQTTATCRSSTISCNSGFYPSSPSYNGITHTTTAPSCATCSTPLANSVLSGPGNVNDPDSCVYTCLSGFFKTSDRGACNRWRLTCNAGFFWTAGSSTSDATCTECSPNYAAGSNRAHYIYHSNRCTYNCSAGFGRRADQSHQCIQCEAGKYHSGNPAENSLCQLCGSKQFQNSLGSVSCLEVPSNGETTSDRSFFTCNAGYYYQVPSPTQSVGSCPICVNCGAGNYRSAACGGTSAGTCSTCASIGCPEFQYRVNCQGSNTGSCTSCSTCNAGFMFGSCSGNSVTDDRSCTPCPVGKAGGGGYSRTCSDCAAGSYASELGATVCSACASIGCPDTHFRTGCIGSSIGSCIRCSSCHAGFFFGSCTGNSLTDNRTCTVCPVGKAGGGGFSKGCSDCAAGSYTLAQGAVACSVCSSIGCSDTHFRSGCVGSSVGNCTRCSSCHSGFFFGSCTGNSVSDDRTCTACPAGKAGGGGYLKACTDCAPDSFSSAEGAKECSICSAGKFSSTTGATWCAECAPIPAQAQFTNLCAWKCNLGYFKDSAASCSLCTSNTTCNAGFFKAACVDGILDTECSLTCATKSQQATSQYTVYFWGSTDASCWWGCNRGFYKNVNQMQCVSSATVCNSGFYPSSASFDSFTTLTTAPSCERCSPLMQPAIFSGPGNPNNASFCPYTCNHGFFKTSLWGACLPWTANCPLGFFWIEGNAMTDATCRECSPNYVSASHMDRNNYVYSPNVCQFKCIPGYGKRAHLNDQCVQCPAGMYHNSSVLNSICQLCGESEYQKSLGMDQCIAVPPFGRALADRSDFTCNHGYIYQGPSPILGVEACGVCDNNHGVLKGALSQIRDILWRSGVSCVVESFSCNVGFYRNWTQQDCIACPSEAPVHAMKISSTSGICPLCNGLANSAERDRDAYCPFQCNVGFYASPGFNYSCIRCSIPVCAPGLIPQLCVLNQMVDQCQNCSYVLQASQNWAFSPTTFCQWHCRAGFFLNISARSPCQMCAPGKIKPLEGNHSCSDCPVGSFAASSTLCQFCHAGSYSNVTSSTVCQPCEMGTFAPSGNHTACISCTTLRTYPSSRTLVRGTSQCLFCPVLFPLSTDGISCVLPIAPCPRGFYLPQLALNNTVCALCPVGTYCDEVQGTLFPKPCPFFRPFSLLPAMSIDNCTATNFLLDERWRTTC